MTHDNCPVILVDHGVGNIGDEAMLFNVISNLRSLSTGTIQFLLTPFPEDCSDALSGYDNVEIIPSPSQCMQLQQQWMHALLERRFLWRYRSRAATLMHPISSRILAQKLARARKGSGPVDKLAQALARCDAVHIVGGGNLNDIWAHSMVWPKLALVRAACLRKKPVFVTGQGIGPLESPANRRAVRNIVTSATYFTLRERVTSPQLLAEVGCPQNTFSFEGDDALTLPKAEPTKMQAFWKRVGLNPLGNYLCANIRFAEYADRYEDECSKLAQLLDYMIEAAGLPLVFLPMSRTSHCNDTASAQLVAERMKHRDRCFIIDITPTPQEAKSVVAGARAGVGLSYHFGVFALSSGVPALLLYRGGYYTSKMNGLADCFDVRELAIPLDNLEHSSAWHKANSVVSNPQLWNSKLLNAADQMSKVIRRTRMHEIECIRQSICEDR
jgi:polysaccharide pyruvyl transferase WcaK-like protein